MAHRTTTLAEWFGLESLPKYWHHKEIRFDIPWTLLGMRTGEEELIRFNEVEDSKGNKGELGPLVITNMRVIWFLPGRRLNLSIGWECVDNVLPGKIVHTQIGKQVFILAHGQSKFEFIFTADDFEFVQVVDSVYKAYTRSRIYREPRFRVSKMFTNGDLIPLPNERIFDKIDGAFHVSGDEGIVGTLTITSVRIVWVSALDPVFNSSLPYLPMTTVAIKPSKYGHALAVTLSGAKVYQMGFRIDPERRQDEVCARIKNLWKLYHEKPIFGLKLDQESDSSESDNLSDMDHEQSQEKLLNGPLEPIHSSLEFEPNSESNSVAYNSYLGLAIEPIPANQTIKEIWESAISF